MKAPANLEDPRVAKALLLDTSRYNGTDAPTAVAQGAYLHGDCFGFRAHGLGFIASRFRGVGCRVWDSGVILRIYYV